MPPPEPRRRRLRATAISGQRACASNPPEVDTPPRFRDRVRRGSIGPHRTAVQTCPFLGSDTFKLLSCQRFFLPRRSHFYPPPDRIRPPPACTLPGTPPPHQRA